MRHPLATAGIALLGALATAHAQVSVVEPASEPAARIAELWWVMLALGTLITLAVYGLLLVAIYKREGGGDRPPGGNLRFAVGGGIVVPLLVLVPLLVYTLAATPAVTQPREPDVRIEVVGHQWWWEVRYPDHGVTTANEIHIPSGRRVLLELTAGDVIHSFWIPNLQGKLDLVPGLTNRLWIEADAPGTYLGQCAEFCGVQHANMRLMVVASPQAEFEGWIGHRAQPPEPPEDERLQQGRRVFLTSRCVQCHTIEGASDAGELGPDLTHIGSRNTLGAGTVPNNRGNLAGWIVNSQAIKPGNRMPPMTLDPSDLQALVAYLESLE